VRRFCTTTIDPMKARGRSEDMGCKLWPLLGELGICHSSSKVLNAWAATLWRELDYSREAEAKYILGRIRKLIEKNRAERSSKCDLQIFTHDQLKGEPKRNQEVRLANAFPILNVLSKQ
jgi:hypothetical protein